MSDAFGLKVVLRKDWEPDRMALVNATTAVVVEVPDGPPMCPCQYSMYKDGVAMMCNNCLGPQQYYRSADTPTYE